MNNNSLVLISCLVIQAFLPGYSFAQEPDQSIHPKNIILLIGDGMGLAQVHAAMAASNSLLNLERCTTIGLAKTSSSDNFITDSAASATAIACGVKTYNGAIGLDSDSLAVRSIIDYSVEAGLATGLVATSTITHATPASFIAHNISRGNYEEIALDFIDSDLDLFIGGGLGHFNNRKDNADLLIKLRERNYQIVTKTADLENVKSGKVAGLLYPKSPPSLLKGRDDMLIRASSKAIELLSQNDKGFFLMIEGSQIDWGGHDKDIEYTVTELIEFDKVVGMVLDYATKKGNTLVIVTADHETGGLAVYGKDVLTKKSDSKFSTGGHSSIMVPVYSYGPQSEQFSGIYENTELFYKMLSALNLH